MEPLGMGLSEQTVKPKDIPGAGEEEPALPADDRSTKPGRSAVGSFQDF